MQKAALAHGHFSKEETDKRAASKSKVLAEIHIQHADNGGHIVEHHFKSEGMYHEPEQHIFSEGEGDKMLAHVAKHMKVKHPEDNGGDKPAKIENDGEGDGEDY